MSKTPLPSTQATRFLDAHRVAYVGYLYRYEEKGGTRVAARGLGVPEHSVVKTLVMEDDDRHPLLVLMHGDVEVSTKRLARHVGCRTVRPCTPHDAARHTGYLVGGTSPFGTRKRLPLYVERTILDLPTVYINGGSRGFLLGLEPGEIVRLLQPALVDVAIGGT